MVAASEVSFTRAMKLLPSGGKAVRAAWGTMMRRRVWRRFMPRLAAASHWPASIWAMAARSVSQV